LPRNSKSSVFESSFGEECNSKGINSAPSFPSWTVVAQGSAKGPLNPTPQSLRRSLPQEPVPPESPSSVPCISAKAIAILANVPTNHAALAVSITLVMMTAFHTIKDKEIPRWQPLQRVHRIAITKLTSHKRTLLLFIAIICLLFLLRPRYTERIISSDEQHEGDEETLQRIRKDFRAFRSRHVEITPTWGKHTAVFMTAHELYNATGLTTLACEMAFARKMNVMMMYVGRNSSEDIPFFLTANQFDRGGLCPMTLFDARHAYSSLNEQESATEAVLREVIRSLNPSVVISLDDDVDWFKQSLARLIYWHKPSISSIQLKRSALSNLHWMTTLSPSALAGMALDIPFLMAQHGMSHKSTSLLLRLRPIQERYID